MEACPELAIAAKYCVGAHYDAARGEIRASRVAERARPDDRQPRRGRGAQARGRGWPRSTVLGRHPSVTGALPWLLEEARSPPPDRDLLRRGDQLRALSPTRSREIAARGHGSRRARLAPRGVVGRSPRSASATCSPGATTAFERLGRGTPRGFRPPGGEVHAAEPASSCASSATPGGRPPAPSADIRPGPRR